MNKHGFAKLTAAVESDNPRVAIWALREILDRAFGKPTLSATVEVQELGEQRGLSVHDAISGIEAMLKDLPESSPSRIALE